MAIPVDMFFMDPSYRGTLQHQIQRMVTEGIVNGRFLPGDKLPSSRKLANHLGVSRITVTLAFTELVAADYLSSKGRSGYFVSHSAPKRNVLQVPSEAIVSKVDWGKAIAKPHSGHMLLDKPANWHDYPYPFVYGQVDERIFDHTNWRLCAVQALGRKVFSEVTSDAYERDDPELIKYIVRNTLPRRGIAAEPDEVLITMGAQNALWLCGSVLLDKGYKAAMEDPGYPGLRAILRMTGCEITNLPITDTGLKIDAITPETDVIFATPSHQSPTNITMPLEQRQALLERAAANDQVIVEDDYEFEISFFNSPAPALKSIDRDGRVIYIGSFSKSLFPGLRLGYVVGPKPFIREVRSLRTASLRHPPGHMQRTVASFLSLGHYDALVARMAQKFRERREVMSNAIDQHGLMRASVNTPGGSSIWMRAPIEVNTADLATRLRERGVLIEPGKAFFSSDGRIGQAVMAAAFFIAG
ncbi:MAG: PLP-dependent aminotransferase family protein, partial [Pseudomonadota bacterium]